MRIVISGWYGNANTGDEAILSATICGLRNTLPEVEITVLSDNPKATAHQHKVLAFPHLPCLLGPVRTLKGMIKWSPRQFAHTLSAMSQADLFLLGGGGLLQDYYADRLSPLLDRVYLYGGAATAWLSEVLVAELMGLPVVLYALGVGPLQTRQAQLLTRIAARRARLITVRDEESKDILTKLGLPPAAIHVTADPSLLLTPADSGWAKDTLQDRGLNSTGRPRIALCPRLWANGSFTPILSQVADNLVEGFNADIILLPLQYWAYESDVGISVKVQEGIIHRERAHLLSGPWTPQEVMALLGQMDLVIGMRLHALILAVAMNVPVVGIVYDPKIRAFLSSINLEAMGVALETLTADHLYTLIQSVWQRRDEIKRDMWPGVEDLKEKAVRNIRLVAELLGKGSQRC